MGAQASGRTRQIHRVCEVLDAAGVPTHDDHGQPISLMLRLGVLIADRDDLRAALELIADPPDLNEDSTPDDWVWGLQGAMKIARETLATALPSIQQENR